jgi:hypothetical protein
MVSILLQQKLQANPTATLFSLQKLLPTKTQFHAGHFWHSTPCNQWKQLSKMSGVKPGQTTFF